MDLKDKFIVGIMDCLYLNGFEYKTAEPYFILREAPFFKVVGLNVSSSVNRYAITPNILIRNEDVAKVMEKFDGDRFKKDHYFTIRTNQYWVAELYGRAEYKLPTHVLKDEFTLRNSIDNFNSFMNDIGFNFFYRFNTITDVDEWFNKLVIEGTYNFKLGDSGGNAKEGLVAAKLNKNPQYEKLYELWIDGLTKEGKYTKTIENLKSLKIYLDNMY